MKNTARTAGAVIATAALASAGIAAAPSIAQAGAAGPQIQSTSQQLSQESSGYYISDSNVYGAFSFNQNATTSNPIIAKTFKTATSALCSSLPEYDYSSIEDWQITVDGDVSSSYTATLGELSNGHSRTTTMTCTCSNNMPGGGAIANAQVTGIPIADIAVKAGIASDVNAVEIIASDGTTSKLPLSYVLAHDALLVYDVNDEDLSASVGGTNQLWIASSAGRYFTRDVVEIKFTHEDDAPAEPSFETTDSQYMNRPNVSVEIGA